MPPATRAQLHDAFLAAHAAAETPLTDALLEFQAQQLAAVEAKLDKYAATWPPASDADAERIAKNIFDSKSEKRSTTKIKSLVKRPLVKAATQGAGLELSSGAAPFPSVGKSLRGAKADSAPSLGFDLAMPVPPDVLAAIETAIGGLLSKPYWSGIGAAIRDDLAGALRTSLEEGESFRKAKARVQDALAGEGGQARAANIARTELTAAMNAGHQAARDKLADENVVTGKEWMAGLDTHTRPTHFAADGQTVGPQDAFTVGGYSAQYPGDPDLPAKERCRCRCLAVSTTVHSGQRSAGRSASKPAFCLVHDGAGANNSGWPYESQATADLQLRQRTNFRSATPMQRHPAYLPYCLERGIHPSRLTDAQRADAIQLDCIDQLGLLDELAGAVDPASPAAGTIRRRAKSARKLLTVAQAAISTFTRDFGEAKMGQELIGTREEMTPINCEAEANARMKAAAMGRPDSAVQPWMLFGGAQLGAGPTVREPSMRYSGARLQAKHAKTGQLMFRPDGTPAELPSQREQALTGTYFRHLALRKGLDIRPLDEHETELLKEVYEGDWCGTVGGQYHPGAKLSQIYGRKGTDLIADGTSGGSDLVPFFFDQDLVTFPLLSSELFPYVDVKELNKSNSVHTGSLNNLTASWNGSEGGAASIPLQSTTGLVGELTSTVYNLALAITIGRDFLSDSPIEVGAEVQKLMGARNAAELDKVIATGDGTTQPLGLSNSTGMVAVTAANGTAGPWTVADVEGMISALPKQYRAKEPSVCWVMNDASWFRLRGISVSSTDQRRIFGYDYERYMLADRPVRINNDLSDMSVFFGKLSLYRLWRRLGLQIELTTEGKTLRLDNELLITARGRYAGRLVDGGGFAAMSNAPIN